MNAATKTVVRLWAFDPICTLCGRRGHYPENCNWKITALPSRPAAVKPEKDAK